jgi:cytochrome c-type biogenesis protein
MKFLWLRIVAFILGFTMVYVLLGISVAFVGTFFYSNMNSFIIVAGVILIVFGLHVARVFRIPWLEGRAGGMDKAKDPHDLLGAFFVGVAFAIGWSPCTGPIIGSILLLASAQGTVAEGGVLLLAYCLGLGLPFLLTGLAVKKFLDVFQKLHNHLRKVELVSAALLIILGILFISQGFDYFRGMGGIDFGGWEAQASRKISTGISP